MQVQELVGIIPWTFIAQICNLFIQMYLIKRFLFKPVHEILEKRRAAADAEITQAEEAKAKAEAIRAEYEQNMQDARQKANEILDGARKTAAIQSEKILKEAQEQSSAMKKKAEKETEQKKQQQAKAAEEGWDTSDINDEWGKDAAGMKSYNCPSCGAELICDETTAATSCPYCGNPTVVPGQFSGVLKPDYVIPFKVSKKEAIEKLKMHYKGRPYLPKSFKDDNHIEEIQGVYVPFWMFDGKASGEASYKATTSKVYEKGDEEITETRHYEVSRAGSIGFEKIPVDASSKMPDDHMDSIEPYDYSGLKEFSTAYLPGFLADKYDVSVKDSQKRADTRCASTLEDALRGTVTGYDSCTLEHKQIDLKRGKVHYALLPVWMLHTKWNGQDFLFAMNGQTGKMVGDLPTSKGKFWGLFAAIAAPMTVVLMIILMLS